MGRMITSLVMRKDENYGQNKITPRVIIYRNGCHADDGMHISFHSPDGVKRCGFVIMPEE
jgi:hypothetical protein